MSDVPREFVFTRYPARQGIVWLRTAYTMFAQHRLNWVMLLLTYGVALLILLYVPVIGVLLVILLKPVLAVGMLAAAWHQERGSPPQIRHLFQGFRANVWALLAIGGFLVIGALIAGYAFTLIDDGKLLDKVGDTMTVEQFFERARDPQVRLAMLVSSLIGFAFLFAAWWAPALVVFQDAGAAAALGTSIRAALANWKAIGAYCVALFLYWNIIPGLFGLLLAILLPPQLAFLIQIAFAIPYMLFLTATMHVADYVSYREVFHANETLAPLSRGP